MTGNLLKQRGQQAPSSSPENPCMVAWSDDDARSVGSHDSDARNDVVNRRGIVTDPEVWADYHSEYLATLYHCLVDHAHAMGVPILDTCTFPQFVHFCFRHSSGRKPPC